MKKIMIQKVTQNNWNFWTVNLIMQAKKIVNQSSDFPVRRTGSYRHKKALVLTKRQGVGYGYKWFRGSVGMGIPWGFPLVFLLVWDGYENWNPIPTAALIDAAWTTRTASTLGLPSAAALSCLASRFDEFLRAARAARSCASSGGAGSWLGPPRIGWSASIELDPPIDVTPPPALSVLHVHSSHARTARRHIHVKRQ